MGVNNIKDNFSKIILITGGTKSGKSEFAEYLGKKIPHITYIALSEIRPNDDNWQKKILVHRERRPPEWGLIESNDLIGILNKHFGPLLVDSIGGFIMESLNNEDKEWAEKINKLLDILKNRQSTTLLVGEQVGWGLVSEYKIGNKYIERLGELQKKISDIANENWITINGRAIQLDDISLKIPT